MEITFKDTAEFNRALGMMSCYSLGLYGDVSPNLVVSRMLTLLHVKELKIEGIGQ